MFDGNLLISDWNPTDIRFASAGGGAVREPAAIYEGGSAPCDPLRPSSPFPTLLSQSHGTGSVGWCRLLPCAVGGRGEGAQRRRRGEKRKRPRGFLGLFSCYSALIWSSVRPVACKMTSSFNPIDFIRRAISQALCSSPSSRPSSRA